MAKIKTSEQELKRIESKIDKFLSERSKIIQTDKEDRVVSRRLSSGFGFSEEDRSFRGSDKTRAEVTVNITDPWINQVMGSYDNNPFGIAVKSHIPNTDLTNMNNVFDIIQSHNDLTDISRELLRDALQDGYGYALVYNEIENAELNLQYPKIKLLENDSVYLDQCDDNTGKDASYGLVFGTIRKSKAKEDYGWTEAELRYTKDIACDYSLVKNSETHFSLITSYELTKQGVIVTKLCAGKVIEEPVLLKGLKRLPIVRNVGIKVWLEDVKHYRGCFWKVYDLMRTLNYQSSSYLERIALNPPIRFIADPKATEGYKDQYDNVCKRPMGTLYYNSVDNQGNPIPAPQENRNTVDTSDLQSGISTFTQLTRDILGSAVGQGQTNETAESVLQKKFVSEANSQSYIKNLQVALEEIGDVCLSMVPILFDTLRSFRGMEVQPVTDVSNFYVEIDSGPLMASQKQKNVAQLLALNGLASTVPEYAGKVLPVIVKNLDIPEDQREYLLTQFMPQQPQQIDPQTQAMMVQKDQQMAQMQEEISRLQGYTQKLEIIIETEQYKIASQQAMNTEDNQTELQKEVMKIQNDNQQLQMKILADQQKQVIKSEADLEKARIANRPEAIELIQGYAPPMNRGV